MSRAPEVPTRFRTEALGAVSSTMEEAARRARAGAPAGTVVRAESQGAGRGRRGRAWASPPGGLYATVVLRPGAPAGIAAQAGLAAALAVAAAGEALGARRLACKWPNDVLDGETLGKVAGLLLEAGPPGAADAAGEADGKGAPPGAAGAPPGAPGGAPSFLLLGMGVNLAPPEESDAAGDSAIEAPGAPPGAAFLRRLGVPPEVGPEALLEAVLSELAPRLETWAREGFDGALRREWLARAEPPTGGPVEAVVGGRRTRGVHLGVGGDGRLLLGRPGGGVERLASAEVLLPAPGAAA